MTDVSERLMEAISALESVADDLTVDEALEQVDEATLQVFWRKWPNLTSWAGGLWRRLNEGLGDHAAPAADEDEVGGSE
jgi:hypothetical protein